MVSIIPNSWCSYHVWTPPPLWVWLRPKLVPKKIESGRSGKMYVTTDNLITWLCYIRLQDPSFSLSPLLLWERNQPCWELDMTSNCGLHTGNEVYPTLVNSRNETEALAITTRDWILPITEWTWKLMFPQSRPQIGLCVTLANTLTATSWDLKQKTQLSHAQTIDAQVLCDRKYVLLIL